jgi:hypothetical protein
MGGTCSVNTQFTEEFSTAFREDTTCSGITLAVYGGPGRHSSRAAEIMLRKDGCWSIQTNFVPGAKTQGWQMNFSPTLTSASSGDGKASSIVHAICLIVKGAGGSVQE